uniref:RE59052p n=1 Tax=Daphnia magna TaxID=35525 RepID=A0A0P6GR59_9CRUS
MLEESKTNVMENTVKLMATEYATKKEKCYFNGHAWLWASIILLVLGQIASFIYLMHAQQNSIDYYSRLKCFCQESDERSFVPPANVSIGETNQAARYFVATDAEAEVVFSRKKRSSSSKAGKPQKHANKKNGRKPRSDKHPMATTLPMGQSSAYGPVTMSPGVQHQANVEFVNPKFRDEYLSRSETGSSPNHADNPWVWLNAYSRIPVNAIQEFCSATKDYCPPGLEGPIGPQGLVGEKGVRGERGDRGQQGETGLRGPVGPIGPQGPKGPKGDMGKTGLPGLNGRDGVPGEPGLDGVPGRSGTPGFDGISGLDGLPGQPGLNGKDGNPGTTGLQGDPGPIGPQGLTGPRGKPGRSGIPGVPGVPGVNTWVVNTTDPRRIVLVPPSILGVDIIDGQIQGNATRTVVIQEGKNLRLRCGTAGNPRPEVSWMRADGSLTPMGSWQTSDVLGPTFNITQVHRDHMGVYVCVADNGIPPPSYRTINVEVHFPPLIRTESPSVGVANGSSVVLECVVEAFPESLCYWERADGRSIDSAHKAFLRDQGKYKVQMTLNLTITNPNTDYGRYHCVSKNEVGITRGEIDVYAMDPRYSQAGGTNDPKLWGTPPSDMVDLEDVCPPPPDCPKCSSAPSEKCRESGLGMFDVLGRLDIRPLGNETYSGYVNRTQDCVMVAIGKPVYHRFTNATHGNWMRDSLPRTMADGDKYWATKFNETYVLYEYINKTAFKKDTSARNYTLPFALKGYLHVVYNGSLYYHQQEESRVIRYELASERNTMVYLPNATVTGNVYLYSQSQSYLDFSVDETGLWVIYGANSGDVATNNTVVAKLNPYSLEIEYIWNISLNNQRAGEMFIACGVLYALDSVTERTTKIRFALDLYRNKLLEVDGLTFTNPFRKTSMVGYNHRNKELYTWDNGNQLTYPVKFTDIGYNTPDNDLANDRIEVSGPEALIQDEWDSIIEIT